MAKKWGNALGGYAKQNRKGGKFSSGFAGQSIKGAPRIGSTPAQRRAQYLEGKRKEALKTKRKATVKKVAKTAVVVGVVGAGAYAVSRNKGVQRGATNAMLSTMTPRSGSLGRQGISRKDIVQAAAVVGTISSTAASVKKDFSNSTDGIRKAQAAKRERQSQQYAGAGVMAGIAADVKGKSLTSKGVSKDLHRARQATYALSDGRTNDPYDIDHGVWAGRARPVSDSSAAGRPYHTPRVEMSPAHRIAGSDVRRADAIQFDSNGFTVKDKGRQVKDSATSSMFDGSGRQVKESSFHGGDPLFENSSPDDPNPQFNLAEFVMSAQENKDQIAKEQAATKARIQKELASSPQMSARGVVNATHSRPVTLEAADLGRSATPRSKADQMTGRRRTKVGSLRHKEGLTLESHGYDPRNLNVMAHDSGVDLNDDKAMNALAAYGRMRNLNSRKSYESEIKGYQEQSMMKAINGDQSSGSDAYHAASALPRGKGSTIPVRGPQVSRADVASSMSLPQKKAIESIERTRSLSRSQDYTPADRAKKAAIERTARKKAMQAAEKGWTVPSGDRKTLPGMPKDELKAWESLLTSEGLGMDRIKYDHVSYTPGSAGGADPNSIHAQIAAMGQSGDEVLNQIHLSSRRKNSRKLQD